MLAGTLVATGWWVTHPTVLPDAPQARAGFPEARPGERYWFGLGTDPDEGTVVLQDVEPRVTRNTADAEVVARVCVLEPGRGGIGATDDEDARRACTRMRDVEDVEASRRDSVDVVLAVTPRRPGTVRVDGVDVTYRDGLQRGTEHSGIAVVVRAG